MYQLAWRTNVWAKPYHDIHPRGTAPEHLVIAVEIRLLAQFDSHQSVRGKAVYHGGLNQVFPD